MEIALRKAKSGLALSGIGSIAFGVWYFVKSILYNLFARRYLANLLGLEDIYGAVWPFLTTPWLFTSALIMALHLYVGLRAVSEGTGKQPRRGIFYLILAGALLLENGFGLASDVRTLASVDGSLLDQVCDVMMDAVRLANMAALIYAAVQTRNLTRKAEQEAGVHAD